MSPEHVIFSCVKLLLHLIENFNSVALACTMNSERLEAAVK